MSEDFKTKGIYSSGMVLQENCVNCIFGTGPKGKNLQMEFRNQKISGIVNQNGEWKIEYNPGNVGGPFELKLECQNQKILFEDVWVGQVWLSSGQSNAQLPMSRMQFSYPQEFALPKNNNIRMITIPISYNFDGEQDSVQNPKWEVAGPESLGAMSGTGYFFAKKISQALNCPVGIINASQGGSPIASWMNKESLEEFPSQNSVLENLKKWQQPGAIEKQKELMQKNQSTWDAEITQSDKGFIEDWKSLGYSKIQDSWDSVQLPGDFDLLKSAGIIWFKKEITLTAKEAELFNQETSHLWLGTIIDADRAYVNGIEVGVTYYSYPPRRYQVPVGILKEGKNTITIRVQKNSKNGPIRFYQEKPLCIFTDKVKVATCAYRNVEKPENKIPFTKEIPSDGVYIPLFGEWKYKIGTKVADCPSGMFFEWVATALYNSMLSPAFNYAISGALWYQGESDAYQPEEYKKLLIKMIDLWRKKFTYAPKDMPFIVMQLPNWSDGHGEDYVSENVNWPAMRQAQAQAVESVKNAGLAVTIDAGEWNDLHPEKKLTGGSRAGLEALRLAYGKKIDSYPCLKSFKIERKKIILDFDCGNSKLVNLNPKELIPGFVFIRESNGKKRKELAFGELIDSTKIQINLPENSDDVKELAYLWSDSPNPISLYNDGKSGERLPVPPFKLKIYR